MIQPIKSNLMSDDACKCQSDVSSWNNVFSQTTGEEVYVGNVGVKSAKSFPFSKGYVGRSIVPALTCNTKLNVQ
jgi:hypothetical protein